MKELFDKIKDREWDMFGGDRDEIGLKMIVGKGMMVKIYWNDSPNEPEYYSLADLLANKSWCKAVWGEGWGHGKNERLYEELKQWWSHKLPHVYFSTKAFQILQQEGEEACIDYIKKTMI